MTASANDAKASELHTDLVPVRAAASAHHIVLLTYKFWSILEV